MAGSDDDIVGPTNPEDYIEVYECDEYEVQGYIVPVDGKVRPNIPVQIKGGNNIYSSTNTNNNGYFSTSFYFPGSGTYTPQVVCGRISEYVTGSYNTYISVLSCSMNLTSTKDILSYADSDTTTITAALICDDDNTAILSNREITFNVRKQSDSSIIQTIIKTTDATGETSFEYESQGIGDIYIEALCGPSVSKTFALRDALYYDGSTHTTTELNIPMSTVPTNFKLEYKMKLTGSTGTVNIGSNSSYIIMGAITPKYTGSTDFYMCIKLGNNTAQCSSQILPKNQWITVYCTYDGSKYTIQYDNNPKYEVTSSYTTGRSVMQIGCGSSTYPTSIKDIIFEPL